VSGLLRGWNRPRGAIAEEVREGDPFPEALGDRLQLTRDHGEPRSDLAREGRQSLREGESLQAIQEHRQPDEEEDGIREQDPQRKLGRGLVVGRDHDAGVSGGQAPARETPRERERVIEQSLRGLPLEGPTRVDEGDGRFVGPPLEDP
jgi:hypothetical protein